MPVLQRHLRIEFSALKLHPKRSLGPRCKPMKRFAIRHEKRCTAPTSPVKQEVIRRSRIDTSRTCRRLGFDLSELDQDWNRGRTETQLSLCPEKARLVAEFGGPTFVSSAHQPPDGATKGSFFVTSAHSNTAQMTFLHIACSGFGKFVLLRTSGQWRCRVCALE